MQRYTEINIENEIAIFPVLKTKISHGFSWGKRWGNMSCAIGNPQIGKHNSQSFLNQLNFGKVENTVNMIPLHTDKIIWIDVELIKDLPMNEHGKEIECDAFFSRDKNCCLVVKPADCVIIIVVAKVGNQPIMGLIHAGWRGIDKVIVTKSINYLVNKHNINPNDIRIGITPHLLASSMIQETIDQFTNLDVWKGAIKFKNDQYYIDMGKAVINQLINSGVPWSNIEYYQVDTYTNAIKGNTFSHRAYKDKLTDREGRFIVAVRQSMI